VHLHAVPAEHKLADARHAAGALEERQVLLRAASSIDKPPQSGQSVGIIAVDLLDSSAVREGCWWVKAQMMVCRLSCICIEGAPAGCVGQGHVVDVVHRRFPAGVQALLVPLPALLRQHELLEVSTALLVPAHHASRLYFPCGSLPLLRFYPARSIRNRGLRSTATSVVPLPHSKTTFTVGEPEKYAYAPLIILKTC